MAKRIAVKDPETVKRISLLEAATDKTPEEIIKFAIDAYWSENIDSVKGLLATLGVSPANDGTKVSE